MVKQLFGITILLVALVGCGTAEETVVEQIESAAGAGAVVDENGAATQAEIIVEETEAQTEVVEEDTASQVVQAEPTSIPPTAIPPTDVPAQPAVAYDAPEWTTVELVNAATGETFTLADFAGKTVFVEPMATWCSNCRAQQQQVATAMADLNPDEFIFISMSVEVGLGDETLASYAQRNGFPQLFTVAPAPFLASLTEQFGRTITSPPSTPHFVISPSGSVTNLSTGRKSSADIVAEVIMVAQG